MDTSFLLDGYEANGNNYDEFKEKVADDAAHTSAKLVDFDSNNVVFLHKIKDDTTIKKIQSEHGANKTPYFVLNRTSLEENDEMGKAFPVGLVPTDELDPHLVAEMSSTTELVMKVDGQKYFVSEMALNTMLQRAKLFGNALQNADLQRNVLMVHSLISPSRRSGHKSGQMKLIIRTAEDSNGKVSRKIFAALSKGYAFIPQTTLIPIADGLMGLMKADNMGEPSVLGWSINHQRTYIYIEFPEVADEMQTVYHLPDKYVPGVMLSTSDVGENSFTVRGCYRRDGHDSYVVTEEVSRQHRGDFVVEDFLVCVDEEIFKQVRALPKVLEELLGRPVMDYDAVDLSTKSGQDANREAMAKALKDASKHLKGSLAKPVREAITRCLEDEINGTRRYTLYDVASIFMDLPDRVEGISKDTTNFADFRKKCGNIPFVLAKTSSAPENDDGDNVFLV